MKNEELKKRRTDSGCSGNMTVTKLSLKFFVNTTQILVLFTARFIPDKEYM